MAEAEQLLHLCLAFWIHLALTWSSCEHSPLAAFAEMVGSCPMHSSTGSGSFLWRGLPTCSSSAFAAGVYATTGSVRVHCDHCHTAGWWCWEFTFQSRTQTYSVNLDVNKTFVPYFQLSHWLWCTLRIENVNMCD